MIVSVQEFERELAVFLTARGIDEGLIKNAASEACKKGSDILSCLMEQGIVDDETAQEIVTCTAGCEYCREARPAAAAIEAAAPAEAYRLSFVPLRIENGVLIAAMSRPYDLSSVDEISAAVGLPVRAVFMPAGRIRPLLDEVYGIGSGSTRVAQASGTADSGWVTRFVDELIHDAIIRRATDIHLLPCRDILHIWFRIDGKKTESPVSFEARQSYQSIVRRIQFLAGMDMTRHGLPQDGIIRAKIDDKPVEIRVSTLPSIDGESVSLRFMGAGAPAGNLKELGFAEADARRLYETARQGAGIIIVTGPTGSGKSTTMHALLRGMGCRDQTVITIEDPVERRIEGCVHIQVSERLDFSGALRSVLRHDPDTILVGEMRDSETARLAVRAAMTGHGVLSTLHTQSIAASIGRLRDLGVEPELLALSLRAVVSQRLVRVLCRSCKVPASEADRKAVSLVSGHSFGCVWKQGAGCPCCGYTGFQGRTAVYEYMVVCDELRQLIREGRAGQGLEECIQNSRACRFDDIWRRKVEEGITDMSGYFWRYP